MPAGQALTEAHKDLAVQLLANGSNQTETGSLIGVSQRSISTIAQERRAEIEALTLNYIQQSIPLIQANQQLTLELSNQLLKAAQTPHLKGYKALVGRLAMLNLAPKDILTIADKKEYRALQIMGIAPSHTPGTVVNMLFQDNRTLAITPAAAEVMAAHFGGKAGEDVIDLGLEDDK